MNTRRLYLVSIVMGLLPPTRAFGLKRNLLAWCGAQVQQNVRITSSVRVLTSGSLSIGEWTFIGHDTLIVGGNADITIGEKVDIGPRVTIVTGSHELFTSYDRAAGPGYSSPVVIEDGVWVGAGSTILGGVTVGRRSMIAAGSVVTTDVSPGVLVGGVPARVIRPTIGSAGG